MRQNPRRNCRRRSGGWLLGDGWCHELSTRLSTRRVKPCTFKRLLLNSHVLPTIFLAEAPCSESIYVRISIDRPKDTAQPAYPPYPHMWPHPSLSVWVRAPTIVLKILRKLPKGGGVQLNNTHHDAILQTRRARGHTANHRGRPQSLDRR